MPKPNDDLTKQDLEKTLEAHAKTIELQILISQQQNQLVEHLKLCLDKVREIDAHFSNGFRSELKEHTHREVQEVREALKEIASKLEKMEENASTRCNGCSEKTIDSIATVVDEGKEHDRKVQDTLDSIDTGVKDLQGSSWKQWWLFGSIAFFSIVNAILTIVALWANGWIIGSGGK